VTDRGTDVRKGTPQVGVQGSEFRNNVEAARDGWQALEPYLEHMGNVLDEASPEAKRYYAQPLDLLDSTLRKLARDTSLARALSAELGHVLVDGMHTWWLRAPGIGEIDDGGSTSTLPEEVMQS
jgi:hypothetical protein